MRSINPTVAVFDLDGVLADFVAGFRALAAGMGKDPAAVDVGHAPPKSDGTADFETGDAEVWQEILRSRTYWRDIPSLVDRFVWRRICALEDSYLARMYFVTNRVGTDVKRQTEEWLELHGVLRPTVIIARRKGEVCAALGADFHLDDKAGNAVYVSYQSPDTASYLLDNARNQFNHDVIGSKVIRVKEVDVYLDAVYAAVSQVKTRVE